MTRQWREFDIIMFDKTTYGIERNWFGYVVNPEIVYDQIGVKWWDDELMRWTEAQNVPAINCLYVGRVDV